MRSLSLEVTVLIESSQARQGLGHGHDQAKNQISTSEI